MDRRHFFRTGLIGSLGAATLIQGAAQNTVEAHGQTARLDPEAMAATYRRQLFEEYLPFWERHGSSKI